MERRLNRKSLKYPHLSLPGKIGAMELENRIIKAPLSTKLAARDGSVTERMIRHYREQSNGGVALVIVEYAFVDHKASKSGYCQLGIADNEHIPGLAWLAHTIKDAGPRAAIQIVHCGRQKFLLTPPIKAPSRVPWEELHARGAPVPEELTFEEIQEIVEAFGDAARRAQLAGFDMVEIHGAHGYLITNFLSPRTNKRVDWYGGSLENRMRFLMEVVANVRKKVGSHLPLSVRLSGSEYEPDGVTIEETVQAAKALEKAGVNAIHVSGGNHHTTHHQICPMFIPPAHNVWAAEALKQVVKIPVIVSGSLNTPELAQEVLEGGKADFVALGRPFFADPYFPKKVFEERPEDIVPCIRCNEGCLERSGRISQSVLCTVNASLGKEDERKIVTAERKKNIAIVGGGPAGMEAARVCALRGHRVTLYEKRQLGGALIEASVPDFKADLRYLINYYSAQIEKLGIEVNYEAVAPSAIARGGYDAAVIAIGSKFVKPDVPGIDKTIVSDALAIFRGEVALGNEIIVIGAGYIGLEVALYLAEQGKRVTNICRRDEYLSNIEPATRTVMLERFAKCDFTVYAGKRLDAVLDEGIIIMDHFGNKEEIAGDNVVLAVDFKPQKWFMQELASLSELDLYMIGDCVKPRNIFDAVHEGYVTGLSI